MAKNRIVEILDFESDNQNFKTSFKNATKRYGKEFISFVKAMWEANDGILSEDEFCKMNCNIPKGFFNNVIKK